MPAPIMQFQFPDVQRPAQPAIIDWNAIASNAINTYVKMRQLGLENEWKERSQKIAEDTFALRREEAQASMRDAEMRTQIERDKLALQQQQRDDETKTRETQRRMYEAQLSEADARRKKAEVEFDKIKDGMAADSQISAMEGAGFFQPFDNGLKTLAMDSTPTDRLKAYDAVRGFSYDPDKRQQMTSWRNQNVTKYNADRLTAALSPDQFLSTEFYKPRYNTGKPRRVIEIEEGANVSAAVRALNGRSEEELTDADRAELRVYAGMPQVKTRIMPDQFVMLSDADLVSGVRTGDREKTNYFLNLSGRSKDAFDYVNRNFGGDRSTLMLQDKAPEGEEYDAFRKIPAAIDTTIAAAIGSAGGYVGLNQQAQRKVGVFDSSGKPVLGGDGKPTTRLENIDGKTNLDIALEKWDEFSRQQDFPETVRKYGVDKLEKLRKSIENTPANAAITAPSASEEIQSIAAKPPADRTQEEQLKLANKDVLFAATVAGKAATLGVVPAVQYLSGKLGEFSVEAQSKIAQNRAISERVKKMTDAQLRETAKQDQAVWDWLETWWPAKHRELFK